MIARHLHSDFHLDNNIVIPAGTDLTVSIAGLHSSELYYEEPKQYRPERFYNEQSDRSNFSFIAFSAGPRNCLGK